ncbi:MAG: hypothetical protein R3266_15595, partial [Gemmatimonadota bacterium]|nr:hypothetical protein [Gemmatimonadota bacterium]
MNGAYEFYNVSRAFWRRNVKGGNEMKNCPWKRTLVLVLALQFGLLTTLEAQSCKSGAKVVSNVWNEYDKVVKQVGCALGAGAVTVATAGVGLPAGASMYAGCLADANAAQKVSEGLVGFWNQLAANKSLTLGPRHLELGREHQGTLRATGARMFVTEPLRGDRLNLWIKKLRYRGPTDVTVCKFPPA